MQIPAGLTHEELLTVDDATAISFLGLEGARVLGTPWMILWMERTSRNLIKEHLPEGWDTVGTMVHVRHLAAAPMGAQVRFTAEILEQTGKRVLLRVEATMGDTVIGDGTHERALIDVARFAARRKS
jgi:fluoroacetyl-CoA thioesterase